MIFGQGGAVVGPPALCGQQSRASQAAKLDADFGTGKAG